MDQISIFDITMPMISIVNKIRLIELFSGYGSQAMALDEIGADYEHWKISEWEVSANSSYNACHIADDTDYAKELSRKEVAERLYELGISNDGKQPMTLTQIERKSEQWQRGIFNEFIQCHNLGSITNVHGSDLEIAATDQYTYFLTYSFPCTDLSVAGKMQGMKKGSGTRSGLLWEVERILTEIHELGGELPQVLFMENVPQVVSHANIKDFHDWQDFLESLGYTNYVSLLNAKNYGVAQNRERCFMFSFLGEYNYKFPEKIPLARTMKDYLEDEVDEKYYVKSEAADKLIKDLDEKYKNPRADYEPQHGKTCYGTEFEFTRTGFSDLSFALAARDYKSPHLVCVGNVNPSGNGLSGKVYTGEISPTLTTTEGQKIVASVLQIGNISKENGFANPQDGRVYDGNGCSPTLTYGASSEPKILAAANRDSSRDGTVKIKQATKQGYINCKAGGVADLSYPNSEMRRGRVQGNGDICPTITAAETGICRIENVYRIRKLIPRECGRLMAVSDDNITKMMISNQKEAERFFKLCEETGIRHKGKPEFDAADRIQKISNTQLYKQFGNSIVVSCMVAMFSNLNIQGLPRWSEFKIRYM